MLDELKTKCNAVYGQAINLLENNGDKNEICRKLLDAATFLVEILFLLPINTAICSALPHIALNIS